jgi:hypothetical protein
VVYFDVPESIIGASASSPISSTVLGKDGEAVTTTTTTTSRDQDAAFFASLRASLPVDLANRVIFETVPSTAPVADVIARASIEVGQSPRNAGDLIVLGRNVARNSVLERENTVDEIRSSSSAAGTLGVLAEKVWEGKLGASVLVVKAGL